MTGGGFHSWVAGTVSALVVLLIGAPGSAHAARVPTGDESAALGGLMQGVMAKCDLERSFGLPLVTDDGTWGRVGAICGDPVKGGPGLYDEQVWAHRSSGTATDWAIVGPTESSRRCTGKEGLLELVPQHVVRDLRGWCRDDSNAAPVGPAPNLTLTVVPADDEEGLDPFVLLSRGSAARNAAGILDYSPTLTLRKLRQEFGKPRRTRCGARWPAFALRAIVCRPGRVTRLTLEAGWQLAFDGEDAVASATPPPEVGDSVELARYLAPHLAGLTADQRFVLARLRIGTADVTTAVVSRAGRIASFQVAIRQRRQREPGAAATAPRDDDLGAPQHAGRATPQRRTR
jgi:hypothetical protein